MLTIKKLSGKRVVSAAQYYTDFELQRQISEYYVPSAGLPQRSRGRWLGRLAARLGLTGDVPEADFLRVLDGRDPRTGGRWIRARRDRVPAIDMAASQPKSVSAAGALADAATSRAIQDAQDYAVEVVFDYLTEHVAVIRKGRNGVDRETARELLAVAFNHSTSRPTKEQTAMGIPADPNSHTHMLVTTARRHDGQLAAIDSRALLLARQELEAVYHAALATKLAEFGFAIERETSGGVGFEIAGIPKALRDDWSSRTREIHEHRAAQIEKFRAQYGREPSQVELRDLDVRCRMPKAVPSRDPASFWRAVGREHGITADTIDSLRERGGLPSSAAGRAQVRAELLADSGLTKEHAAFTTRRLRVTAFRKAAGVITVADCERVINDLITDGEVVQIGKGRWTTRAMLDMEQGVLAWREQRRTLPSPPRPSSRLVWRAIRGQQQARDVTLANEQLTALDAMLTERFVAITGEAGSGKNAVVGAAAQVWRAHHRRVFAIAVAGATAQRLGENAGDSVTPMTLDGLVTRLEHGALELRDDDVIVVDEAAMVDTRRWARFVSVVKDRGTVVALGDHAQLSPLSAGGLWPLLAHNGPELQQVHRTSRRWEQTAWKLLRTGEIAAALRLYARTGHVTVSSTREASAEAAVEAWNRDGRTGVLITDSSNAERDRLNALAQNRRRTAGELGPVGVRLSPTGPAFHTGDRVIFRRQWRIGNGIRRVENGTTGIVVGVDRSRAVVTVRTAEQHPRDLDVAVDSDPLLGLAYAAHVYKAQGMTVGTSYVVSGGWQTHREALYVACSRSRDGTRLFLDSETLGGGRESDALAAMAERGRRSRAKRAATALPSPSPGDAAIAPGSGGKRPGRRRPLPPLTERYRRRLERQCARANKRWRRAQAAAFARQRSESHWPQGVEDIAARQGVPAWALRAFEEVTDTRVSDRGLG